MALSGDLTSEGVYYDRRPRPQGAHPAGGTVVTDYTPSREAIVAYPTPLGPHAGWMLEQQRAAFDLGRESVVAEIDRRLGADHLIAPSNIVDEVQRGALRHLRESVLDGVSQIESRKVADREALIATMNDAQQVSGTVLSLESLADAILASGIIRDEREAKAEALEAFAAWYLRVASSPTGGADYLAALARAAEIRKGRA